MIETLKLRIIVASPGDVAEERELIPHIFDEINKGFAAERNVTLEPVRWETDTYPDFHSEGPQGQVDEGLSMETCDGLIGIFWARFGKPVKDAGSGTEHEITKAIALWRPSASAQAVAPLVRERRDTPMAPKKPIMLYFCNRRISPESNAEQLAQVQSFKSRIENEGYWWTFDDVREFERLLRQHLILYLRQHFPMTRVSESAAEVKLLREQIEEIRGLAATVLRAEWASKHLAKNERKLALSCYEQLRSLVTSAFAKEVDSTARFNALERWNSRFVARLRKTLCSRYEIINAGLQIYRS